MSESITTEAGRPGQAEAIIHPAVPSAEKIDPKIWRVAAVVFLGPLMAQLDSTVVNFSLSQIREDLHATLASAQWIISGYLLALALLLPLNGWLVDRLGAKRLYLICFSSFTGASLLCGMLARGMGQGATGLPTIAAAYASVPKDQLGVATTASNIIQRLGGPIMTTALAFIIALNPAHSSTADPQEFLIPFLALIGLQSLVFITALGLPLWIHQDEHSKRRT